MNIIEAGKALNDGKKVRRASFITGFYFVKISGNQIIQRNDFSDSYSIVTLNTDSVLADDWEVFEEKSDMDKAWESIPPSDERSSYGYFRMGWNAAQKHPKSNTVEH